MWKRLLILELLVWVEPGNFFSPKEIAEDFVICALLVWRTATMVVRGWAKSSWRKTIWTLDKKVSKAERESFEVRNLAGNMMAISLAILEVAEVLTLK